MLAFAAAPNVLPAERWPTKPVNPFGGIETRLSHQGPTPDQCGKWGK